MQQVVTNLQISQIELRSEDSFDIQRYVHERQVEKFVVPFQGEILEIKTAFLKVHMARVLWVGREREYCGGVGRWSIVEGWGGRWYSSLSSSGSVRCGESTGSARPPLSL